MQKIPRAGRRPVIGICGVPALVSWSFLRQDAVLVPQTYLRAIVEAGGQPVILPPGTDLDPALDVPWLDGVLLAGGTDVEPELYGSTDGRWMEETCRERDLFERDFVVAAFRADLPILGICRGLQVLNVSTGGTLHQHLLDEGYAEHRPVPGRLDSVTNHEVRVASNSWLTRCGLDAVAQVNSHHHQGVAELGEGARPVAWSRPDGVVEAVEWPSQTFALGVQWHPEDPLTPRLFEQFVAVARASMPPVPEFADPSSPVASPEMAIPRDCQDKPMDIA